uniref:hypothetical protein n=1 Tax=Coprococcus catus TaxID=116085 RepID=UPI0022E67648|nr:hypothetical protein [Coprococcus catus]
MREKTYHLYLNEEERSRVIQSLIALKNNLAAQGRYTDAVDEFLETLTEYYFSFFHSFLPLSSFGDCLTWLMDCDLSFAINNRELLLL